MFNINIKQVMSVTFPLGPIQVVDEHFNAVLLNCYDAIGIMLMIRIIHQHQVRFELPIEAA
jgi:hypothetical protein